jgi:hypothetical protein
LPEKYAGVPRNAKENIIINKVKEWNLFQEIWYTGKNVEGAQASC